MSNSIIDNLDTFAGRDVTVEVTRQDGKTFEGKLVQYVTDSGATLYKVLTGKRGRPPVLAVEEITAVSAVAV